MDVGHPFLVYFVFQLHTGEVFALVHQCTHRNRNLASHQARQLGTRKGIRQGLRKYFPMTLSTQPGGWRSRPLAHTHTHVRPHLTHLLQQHLSLSTG